MHVFLSFCLLFVPPLLVVRMLLLLGLKYACLIENLYQVTVNAFSGRISPSKNSLLYIFFGFCKAQDSLNYFNCQFSFPVVLAVDKVMM